MLSRGIEVTRSPFLKMAETLGVSEEEVVEAVRVMMEEKKIRRFAAVLKQSKIGYSANAMCVFNISTEKIEFAGEFASSLKAVSHCYERAGTPSWNYNLYAMVHAKSKPECEKIAETIAAKTCALSYKVLFSVRELKKQNAVYFGDKEFNGV